MPVDILLNEEEIVDWVRSVKDEGDHLPMNEVLRFMKY